jgi:hypothetical protein
MDAGTFWRLIDSRFTQLEAQGPYRTCNESNEEEEEEEEWMVIPVRDMWHIPFPHDMCRVLLPTACHVSSRPATLRHGQPRTPKS